MFFFRKWAVKKTKEELRKKAFCLVMYSTYKVITAKKDLLREFPFIKFDDQIDNFDNACIVAACYSAMRKILISGDSKLEEELAFLVLTCLKIWDIDLFETHYKFLKYLKERIPEREPNKSADFNNRRVVGLWITENSHFSDCKKNVELTQKLGSLFGIDFIKYWEIPLQYLDGFRMNNYDLEKLILIISFDNAQREKRMTLLN